MSKYEALFEDENDIFGGTPVSKYWDIVSQTHEDLARDEFDRMVDRISAMEILLSEHHDMDELNTIIERFILVNNEQIEAHKKNVYLELAGKLIYRVSD